jgi:hypothetical protein
MKITKIEYIKTLVPNMSCGTGYSEPDMFHITCNTGYEADIWVDIWYRQESYYKQEFIEGLIRVVGDNCHNIDEAFEMYKEALKNKR